MNLVSIIEDMHFCYLILLSNLFEFVNSQSLNFLKYDQKYSITKCTQGLIWDMDISAFKARLDNYQKADYLKFKIHTTNGKIHELPTVDFKNPCPSNIERLCIVRNETLQINIYKEADTEFNKHKVDYKNVTCANNNETRCDFLKDILWINIYIKAKKEFNNARIQGTLFLSGSDAKSDNQTFPEMYDSSNYTLIISGVDEKESVCVFNGSGSIPLEFKLECSNQLMTCFSEIMSDKRTHSNTGTNGIAFTKIEILSVNASIETKYEACSLFENRSRGVCTWENKVNGINKEQEKDDKLLKIGLPIIIIMVILAILVCIFLWCFFKRKRKKQSETKQQVDEPEEDTPFVDGPQPRAEVNSLNNDPLHAVEKVVPKIFPISSFTIKDLPEDYKNTDLVLLIKYISNLTGRLNISYASVDRPQFYPYSDVEYPYYNKRGKRFQRFANGIVVDVKINNTFTDTICRCPDCKISTSPNIELGTVCFLTARSVIFDKHEAQSTDFKLFYDNNDVPELKEIQYLSGTSVNGCDTKLDWCEVECSTCDEKLFETLRSNLENCKEKMKSVNNHYMQPPKNTRLTIIVFHPSEKPKHVSFGFTTNREIAKQISKYLYTNYEYNNTTSEGRAGAFVYVLGVSDISLRLVHVHVGTSYSNYGLEIMSDQLMSNESTSRELC